MTQINKFRDLMEHITNNAEEIQKNIWTNLKIVFH